MATGANDTPLGSPLRTFASSESSSDAESSTAPSHRAALKQANGKGDSNEMEVDRPTARSGTSNGTSEEVKGKKEKEKKDKKDKKEKKEKKKDKKEKQKADGSDDAGSSEQPQEKETPSQSRTSAAEPKAQTTEAAPDAERTEKDKKKKKRKLEELQAEESSPKKVRTPMFSAKFIMLMCV